MGRARARFVRQPSGDGYIERRQWFCRIVPPEYFPTDYLECLVLCSVASAARPGGSTSLPETPLKPENYPLYKRRAYDRFCKLLHVFPVEVLPEGQTVSMWLEPNRQRWPFCGKSYYDPYGHACYEQDVVLPMNKCRLRDPDRPDRFTYVPCPRNIVYVMDDTLLKRIAAAGGVSECVALPIKSMEHPYTLSIGRHGGHDVCAFPKMAPPLFLSLVAHMRGLEAEGSPSMWGHIIAEECHKHIRSWGQS